MKEICSLRKTKRQQILPNNSGSICYSATMSNKKINEDAHIHLQNKGLNIFAVADGLGSYSAAAEASHQVVKYIKENADKIVEESAFLSHFFQDMNKHLCEIAQTNEYKTQNQEKLLGTTLILGIETEEKVTFAYIGNGAIIHIRGTISDFEEKDDPWFAVNLLNPHTVPQNGSDALYKLLSNDDELIVKPTIISINKDIEEGDAFILCTDGIASHDHTELFRHPTIGLLSKYNDKLLELFALLKEFQYTDRGNAVNHLESKITLFLEKNKENFTDDATLALLVTDKFIKTKC